MNKGQFLQFWHEPRKLAIREWARKIHLWSGVAIGLILSAITLSGSAIVLRNNIGFALHRPSGNNQNSPTAPPLQSVIEGVAAQNTNFTVAEVDGLNRSDGLLLVRLRPSGHDGSDRDVFIDSHSGAIVPGHPRLTSALETLEDFHKNLLIGRRGRGVEGLVAILFLAVVLTAPVIWWSGIARWTRGLKINLSLSWKRINYDFHSVLGISSFLFLGIMSLTATLLATPDVLHLFQGTEETVHHSHHHDETNAGSKHASDSGPSHLSRNENAAAPSIDSVISGLHNDSELSGWQLASIRMPDKGRDIQAELERGSTTIVVDIDPSTGMPASISEPQRFGVSMDAHNIVEAVHFGRIGGMSTQLLWITLGLCPTFLVITGYIMWWNRVLSKRLRAIS